jgi:outer membrane protein OmpA-like peptidoglycan-associated protein
MEEQTMSKLSVLLLVSATIAVASGCASKKYVRNEVKTSADTLAARIETTQGEIKEVADNVDKVDKKVAAVDSRVSGVDTRVSQLDSKTSEQFSSVRTDVQGVDQKAGLAQTAADRAGTFASLVDQRFQNRNKFNVTDEKSVRFKLNSATLEDQYKDLLDGIAAALTQNPDAIVVLEGRTDSTGTKDYNVKLGERRIEAVRRYLAIEKGVAVFRIHDISFGAEKPVAENNTKEGREKNRAVKMTILVPKSEGAVASKTN